MNLEEGFLTSCPSYSLWFKRFVQGIYKRMEYEVHQDQAVTLELVHRLIKDLEKNSQDDVRNDKREYIANQADFKLVVFLAALREEKVFKLNLGETRIFFLQSTGIQNNPTLYFLYVKSSRVKLERSFTL